MLVALALILSSLVIATPATCAQAQTAAEITGRVLDSSKAAIPNAAVTATNSATGAVRKAQTDNQGHYALTELPVGTYSITVEREGVCAEVQLLIQNWRATRTSQRLRF